MVESDDESVNSAEHDPFKRNGSGQRGSSKRHKAQQAQKALQTTFITVETGEGNLEQLQVRVEDEHFGTTAPILQSLAERGEIAGQVYQNAPRSSSLVSALRRGSLVTPDNTSADTFSMEPPAGRQRRSDSIVTPGLLSDLRKNRQRMVAKGGQVNVELTKIAKKRRQFIKDLFTTFIDMQWRYTLLAFAASFFVSWLIFGVVYYIIAEVRGDFEPDHLPGGVGQKEGTWKPCVWAIEDFASCFLFSVETQHTIGYGSRQTTEKCPEAIIVMCVQSVVGVIISACMAGIVFAKLARPKARSNTVMFSKNAVVSQRNGDLWLLFRVGNMRRSHIIEAHVRAQIVHHRKVTKEGESLHYEAEELKVFCGYKDEFEDEALEERTLMLWPVTVAHRIDADSPLYAMGPRDLLSSRFELIVSMEGIVEPTGNSVQARSSYLPNEILWGHRFEAMVCYNKKRAGGTYLVDCSQLNAVVSDDCTPQISRKAYDEKMNLEQVKLDNALKTMSSTGNINQTDFDEDNGDVVGHYKTKVVLNTS